MQLFKFNREGMDYYAEVLNKYHDGLGMMSPCIPYTSTASEFIKLRKYSDITDSQNDAMDYLYGRLDPGIVTVNVYDALNQHKDEYIYFKTDHHWTALGAITDVCLYGDHWQEPVPLSRYETVRLKDILGAPTPRHLTRSWRKTRIP